MLLSLRMNKFTMVDKWACIREQAVLPAPKQTQAIPVPGLSAGPAIVQQPVAYHYNLFGQAGYTFHPLLNGGLASIYSPQARAFFLNPVPAFPNFDLDAVAQLFLDAKQGKFRMTSKAACLRLK